MQELLSEVLLLKVKAIAMQMVLRAVTTLVVLVLVEEDVATLHGVQETFNEAIPVSNETIAGKDHGVIFS